MANPQAVGTEGTPFRMDIERGKIREFALATGADHPAYLEAERPVIPPTFLTTTFFWQTGDADPWPAVQLDQQRGLHAEQEFTFFGPPPRAGTRLTCQSRITDVYTKTGRRGGELSRGDGDRLRRDRPPGRPGEADRGGAAQPPKAT